MIKRFIISLISFCMIIFINPSMAQEIVLEELQSSSSFKDIESNIFLDRIPEEMYPAFHEVIAWLDVHADYPMDTYRITSFHHDGDWALATLTSIPSLSLAPDCYSSQSRIQIILQKTTKWNAVTPTMPTFENVLVQVPDAVLSANAKIVFSSIHEPDATRSESEPLLFPWAEGESWNLTQGWHNGIYVSTCYLPYSVDFAPAYGATDTRILAAHAGTVTYICEGTLSRNVLLEGLDGTETAYLHIDPATLNVHQGQSIPQGFVLGSPIDGFNSDECGSWQGSHLHFELPSQTLTIDGWTSAPSNIWTHMTEGTKGIYSWFESSNAPQTMQSVVEGYLYPQYETVSGNANIAGWTSSNLNDIERVDIVINDHYIREATFINATEWTWNWDTTLFGNGEYRIAVRVTTKSGTQEWLKVLGHDSTYSFTISINNDVNTCLKPLYRYVRPDLYSRHVYALHWNDFGIGTTDWKYEGIAGYVAKDDVCATTASTPLYRLYSETLQKYMVTTNIFEAFQLIYEQGYTQEEIIGYVASAPDSVYETCPFYRLYSAERNDHFYTCSNVEKAHALAFGFTDQGIAGYLFRYTPSSIPPSPLPEPPMVKRADWDALEPIAMSQENHTPNHIVIHHTASINTLSPLEIDWEEFLLAQNFALNPFHHLFDELKTDDYRAIRDTYAGIVWRIQRQHMYVEGYDDIGYHYLIDPHGTIYEGRKGGPEYRSESVDAANSGVIAIAYLGTFTDTQPTDRALQSGKILTNWLVERYRIDPNGTYTIPYTVNGQSSCVNEPCDIPTISTHKQVGEKTGHYTICPGKIIPQIPNSTSLNNISVSEGIIIGMFSPARISVIDAQGRRTGFDPDTKIFVNEIPETFYGSTAAFDDHDDTHIGHNPFYIYLPPSAVGLYTIDVLGTDEGLITLAAKDTTTDIFVALTDTVTLGKRLSFQLLIDPDHAESLALFDDHQAPETHIIFEGTEGNSGWYITPVTIHLSATDKPVEIASGVAYTEISLDHGVTWEQYDNPLMFTDGIHPILVRSIDRVGNREDAQGYIIQIDTNSPSVDIHLTRDQITRIDTLTITWAVSDPQPGSGIESVEATFGTTPISDGESIDLFWHDLGLYTVSVTVTDIAGWSTTDQTSLNLTASIESLIQTVDRLCEIGDIDNRGICHALRIKLIHAKEKRDLGQDHVAVKILHAFLHQVDAQVGKHLSSRGARILTMDSQYVTEELTGEVLVSPRFGARLQGPESSVIEITPPQAFIIAHLETDSSTTEHLASGWKPIGQTFTLEGTPYLHKRVLLNLLEAKLVWHLDSRYDQQQIALAYWKRNQWEIIVYHQSKTLNTTLQSDTAYSLWIKDPVYYLPTIQR